MKIRHVNKTFLFLHHGGFFVLKKYRVKQYFPL